MYLFISFFIYYNRTAAELNNNYTIRYFQYIWYISEKIKLSHNNKQFS